MALLGDHLIRQVSVGETGELVDVLAVAEAALHEPTPPEFDILTTGLIEALHHGASHEPEAVEQTVTAELPDGLRSIWDQCRELHVRVEQWLKEGRERAGTGIEEAMFDDEALRSYLRSTYWRSSSGNLVGLADVLTYQVDQVVQQREEQKDS